MLKLLDGAKKQKDDQRRAAIDKSLIHFEASIGGKLFGPLPKGHRREFFRLDKGTWVWHEEWNDEKGHHAVTTRYDVHPYGVLKSQGNSSYQKLTGVEARNFYKAVEMYGNRVHAEYQHMLQAA